MEWRDCLRERLRGLSRVAILGVGSELCGDDAAGMLLIEELRVLLPDDGCTLLLAGSTAPENFTGPIRDYCPQLLLVVDAAHIGGETGAIAVVDAEAIGGMEFSTHMLPFGVMLAYICRETGAEVMVVGMQPGNTEFATPPSIAIISAVHTLAETIAEAICQ